MKYGFGGWALYHLSFHLCCRHCSGVVRTSLHLRFRIHPRRWSYASSYSIDDDFSTVQNLSSYTARILPWSGWYLDNTHHMFSRWISCIVHGTQLTPMISLCWGNHCFYNMEGLTIIVISCYRHGEPIFVLLSSPGWGLRMLALNIILLIAEKSCESNWPDLWEAYRWKIIASVLLVFDLQVPVFVFKDYIDH